MTLQKGTNTVPDATSHHLKTRVATTFQVMRLLKVNSRNLWSFIKNLESTIQEVSEIF